MRFIKPKRKDIILALFVYLMNVVDALFTLHYTRRGAAEINPVMNFVLSLGEFHFLFFKIVVVGLLTVVLLFLPINSRLNNALLFFSGFYALIVLVHILSSIY